MKKNIKAGVYSYNDKNIDFEFSTNLVASKKISFVNLVVDTLVSENYNFIIKDLIFDYVIIQLFTDVDTSDIGGIDMIEEFLEQTNIVDIVKENAKNGLIEELKKSVELNIEYRTGIHTNPINEAITSLVKTLEKKTNEIDLTSAMEMAKTFSKMTDDFTPESIVKAYLQSDVHKENLKEIETFKNK